MRLFPLLLAAALAGCASTDKEPVAFVSLVKIPVTDIAKSGAFYRDALGLEEEFSSAEYGWAQYRTGGVPLCLYVPGKGGGTGAPGGCESVHLVVADVRGYRDALAKRWKSPIGALMKGEDGSMFFDVDDPDGNSLRIMQGPRQ